MAIGIDSGNKRLGSNSSQNTLVIGGSNPSPATILEVRMSTSYVGGVIDESDPRNPIFRTEINGRLYSFTVGPVKPDSRDWLRGIIDRQLQEAFDDGVAHGKNQARIAFNTFLGMIGSEKLDQRQCS